MQLRKFCMKIIREIIRLFHPPLHVQYYLMRFIDKKNRTSYDIHLKKFTLDEIDRLLEIEKIFPKNVLTCEQTIDEIINNKKSMSRFGDGEEFGTILNDNPQYPLLQDRLIEIFSKGSDDKCLVCTNNFNAFDKNLLMFWRNHFGMYWLSGILEKISERVNFNKDTSYGDAYSFLFYFNNNDNEEESKRKLDKIKSIWQDRKILFVLSENSNILKDEKYFANAAEKAYVYGPSSWAFREYDSILNKITQNYDKDWLVYLELGSCATVLSYDLSRLGYQALDMGGFYSRIITSKRYKNLV